LEAAQGKPDLSITNIRTVPVYPEPGEEVVFIASLINNGTAPTKAGEKHLVHFTVNGEERAYYYSVSDEIPVGGMKVICAQGTNNKNWKATNGIFNISASIELLNSDDLNLNNNSSSGQLTVPNGKVIPLDLIDIVTY